MRFIRTLVAAVSLTLAASTSSALTCSSSATFTLDVSNAVACFTGNDSNQVSDPGFEMFGETGWLEADKNDDSATGFPITFTGTGLTNGSKNGTWEINVLDPQAVGSVVVSLKAGNGFGAFLIADDVTSGFWTSTKSLSHASIFYLPPVTIVPTPLPAGAWLLISAFGGLGLWRRFKTRKDLVAAIA